MDPDADVELLESLESEIGQRLQAGVELKVNAKPMLETLEDSLSNSVQVTEMKGNAGGEPTGGDGAAVADVCGTAEGGVDAKEGERAWLRLLRRCATRLSRRECGG
jgi:hypothetical protein